MSKAPAFQLYAQDFLTGVTYLTNEEIGMYIKMLCKQWTDGSIPKKRLGFLIGREWEQLSEELREKFIEDGENLINERLEEVRCDQNRRVEAARENGKKGGRPKKNEVLKKPIESSSIEDEVEDRSMKNENDSLEKSEKPFSDEVLKCYNQCLNNFPSHLRPQIGSKNEHTWVDTIDKLHRIDKISFENICSIVHWARDDNFWQGQFLSIPKLRDKDKQKIKYVVVFQEKMKVDQRYPQSNNRQQHQTFGTNR